MIKLWDANVNMEQGQTQASPYYFQSFIGHTFSVRKVIFNPNNNSQCISVAGKDGIYLWKFFGDISIKESEQDEQEAVEIESPLKEESKVMESNQESDQNEEDSEEEQIEKIDDVIAFKSEKVQLILSEGPPTVFNDLSNLASQLL